MIEHTIKLINEIEEDQYRSDLQICKLALSNYLDELEVQRTNDLTKLYLKKSSVIGIVIFTVIVITRFIW